MTVFTTISLLERYLDVNDDTMELYYQLGLPYQKQYKYRERSYPVNEIEYVDPIMDCPEESLVIFEDGHKIVVLENCDELWIRVNDIRNGNVELEGN